MRFVTKVRLGAGVAGCVGLALVGLRALGQTAPAQTGPATQGNGGGGFAKPVFTEDFETGDLAKGVWEVRIGGGAGGGRGGARGAAAAATGPATAPTTEVAAASAPAATAPASAPAAGGGAGGPTITVEHDVAAHGKNAVLVHYPVNSRAYAYIVASHLPDALKNHFFGRAYVQFPKAPPNAHDSFITCGSAGFPTSNFMEIGLRQNKAQMSYQQNGPGPTRGETMIAGPAYPVGKWFCLEWEFNDTPDTITVWIDGEKVVDNKVAFQGVNTNLVKGFSDFAFGFRSFGNVPNGFDVYYDDIAFGTERIGPIK